MMKTFEVTVKIFRADGGVVDENNQHYRDLFEGLKKTISEMHRSDGRYVINLRNPSNYVLNYSYIQPGQSLTLKFSDKKYFLFPFERVTYRKKGKVDLRQRKGYKEPKNEFPVTVFLNRGGHSREVVMISMEKSLLLPLGIPIRRHLDVSSFFADFSDVIIENPTPVAVPDFANPGSIKFEYRQNMVKKLRPESELKKIKTMRERLVLRSVGLG